MIETCLKILAINLPATEFWMDPFYA